MVEIYPKVLDLGMDYLKFNGTEGSISVKTLSLNKLLMILLLKIL